MNEDIKISIVHDRATPLLRNLTRIAQDPEVRQEALNVCIRLTENFIRALPPNRRGWPSTGFWGGVQTKGEVTSDGFVIECDNPEAPGAFRFRHYAFVNGSASITMKDKMLTIPISPVSYGHRAADFKNLFLLVTKKGAYLVQRGEGVSERSGRMVMNRNMGGNGGRRVRANLVFLFILMARVTQFGKYPVVPAREDYADAVRLVLLTAYAQLRAPE